MRRFFQFVPLMMLAVEVLAGSVVPRVVSLSPALTETVWKLAPEALIGRSSACDCPPEVRDLPVAGDFGRPDVERTLLLKPDCVIADAECPGVRWERLNAFGVRVKKFRSRDLSDYPETVRQLGELLHCPEAAQREIARFKAELQDAAEGEVQSRPRVLVILNAQPLISCGGSGFLPELIVLAGGCSVTADQSRPYLPLSLEFLAACAPDLIVFAGVPELPPAVRRSAAWRNLPAVRNGHVRRIEDDAILCRLGPRTPEGLRRLKSLIREARQD